jgi:phage-related minor tail protein
MTDDSLNFETDASFRNELTRLDTEFMAATRSAALLGKTLTSAFDAVALRGKSLGDVFSTLALSLSQATLKAAFQPLQQNLGGFLQNLFTGSVTPFAKGGILQGGTPVPFAAGGVIASPIAFPLAGGRTGIAGERGPEAILPLTRGADGRLGVAAGGGAAPSITVNITTPDAESFRRSETQLAALLARAVAQGHRNV